MPQYAVRAFGTKARPFLGNLSTITKSPTDEQVFAAYVEARCGAVAQHANDDGGVGEGANRKRLESELEYGRVDEADLRGEGPHYIRTKHRVGSRE